jgi:two-component system, NarL family, sensor histidine kinase UhpB
MKASKGMRQVSAELCAVALDTLGLTAALEWRARRFQKLTGASCQLKVDPAAPANLPEDYATTVFEFYNEALKNVARHAMASRVAVALTITRHQITVEFRLPPG